MVTRTAGTPRARRLALSACDVRGLRPARSIRATSTRVNGGTRHFVMASGPEVVPEARRRHFWGSGQLQKLSDGESLIFASPAPSFRVKFIVGARSGTLDPVSRIFAC